jgi:hypothetical protein
MNIPLLFTYKDRVVGMGFTAMVSSHGRVLATTSEGDEDVWIYGVEPGALAASGSDPKEALEAFRQSFTNILRDFAGETHTFEDFSAAVNGFFNAVNEENAREWQLAVDAVRAGQINIPDIQREPAESRRFVQVQEERPVDQRVDFAVKGSSIRTSVAA